MISNAVGFDGHCLTRFCKTNLCAGFLSLLWNCRHSTQTSQLVAWVEHLRLRFGRSRGVTSMTWPAILSALLPSGRVAVQLWCSRSSYTMFCSRRLWLTEAVKLLPRHSLHTRDYTTGYNVCTLYTGLCTWTVCASQERGDSSLPKAGCL